MIVYSAADLTKSTLPPVSITSGVGMQGILLINNSIWELSISSTLGQYTILPLSIYTLPTRPNEQWLIVGNAPVAGIAAINSVVSWSETQVLVPLTLRPLAAIIANAVNANITNSNLTVSFPSAQSVDANITNSNLTVSFPNAQDINISSQSLNVSINRAAGDIIKQASESFSAPFAISLTFTPYGLGKYAIGVDNALSTSITIQPVLVDNTTNREFTTIIPGATTDFSVTSDTLTIMTGLDTAGSSCGAQMATSATSGSVALELFEYAN